MSRVNPQLMHSTNQPYWSFSTLNIQLHLGQYIRCFICTTSTVTLSEPSFLALMISDSRYLVCDERHWWLANSNDNKESGSQRLHRDAGSYLLCHYDSC